LSLRLALAAIAESELSMMNRFNKSPKSFFFNRNMHTVFFAGQLLCGFSVIGLSFVMRKQKKKFWPVALIFGLLVLADAFWG